MKLEVNFEKKYFIASVLIVALIVGGVYVYAQTFSPTPNPGHNVADIGGIPNCLSTEVLTQSGGVWTCVSKSGLNCVRRMTDPNDPTQHWSEVDGYDWQYARANCLPGETIVGGGGNCGGNAKYLQASYSLPGENAWWIACTYNSESNTRAVAICCR